jgi:hypothetical protein
MATHIHVIMNNNPGKRRVFHSILAILTGFLILLWPDALYYILGSYLIATGIMSLIFRAPSFLVAAAIVTGIFIFIFPSFIPYFFAFFLLVIGLGSLLSGGFGLAVIPLLAAAMLLAFPDIISIIVAAFLLLYGFTSIITLIQSRSKDKEIIEVY